jgi:NTE family protein
LTSANARGGPSSETLTGRAVILGGGSVTGLAWETGILRGLEDAGVRLPDADTIIGTSAGSFAGAYLAFEAVDRYFEMQLDTSIAEIATAMSSDLVQRWQNAFAEGRGDTGVVARSLGALALSASTVSTADRMKVVASRLPGVDWPDRPLKMTAIDAETGELHLLDRTSGITLTVAAAASGAVPGVWPVVEALGRKWIDGGSTSSTNACLGERFESVLVIAPVTEGFPGYRWVGDDVEHLRSAGGSVALIAPDDASKAAIGENVFDPSRRGAVAEAGRRQGRALGAKVQQVWAA